MNKVFLIGNLTSDPELTQTPNGISLCRFSIAVSRDYRQGDGEKQTDFFNCTAWRGLGENIAKYQKKGQKLAVIGSIQIRKYEDNQGVKRTAVDIICDNVEFLSKPTNDNDYDEEPTKTSGKTIDKPNDKYTGERKKVTMLDYDGDDSDVPF